MKEIEFAKQHQKICTRKKPHHTPSGKLHCGKKLYRFLTKHELPLDIYYNQNKFSSRS